MSDPVTLLAAGLIAGLNAGEGGPAIGQSGNR